MKVIVDYDLCEANAVCMNCCPEVFRVEDDDSLTILVDKIPEPLRGRVAEAVRLCPRQALRVSQR
jgi:ferredoxin